MHRPHRLPRPSLLLALAAGLVAGSCGGTLYDAAGVPALDTATCNEGTHTCPGVIGCVPQDPAACGEACRVCTTAVADAVPACKAPPGGAFDCAIDCVNNTRLCPGNACLAQSPTACGGACTDCTAAGAVANGQRTCADQGGGAFACDYTCSPGFFKANGGCERPAVVVAGGHHTCAVTVGGALLCWGVNDAGQLGHAGAGSPTPVVVFPSGVGAAAAGGQHTCAVHGGVLKCWGANDVAQLGRGAPGANSATPTAVSGTPGAVTALAAGANHTCALAGGAVRCWGANAAGQSGTNTTGASVDAPGAAAIASGVTAIAAGGGTTCATTSAGGLLCWGANGSGQAGRGTTTQALAPLQVTGLPAAAAPPLSLLGLAVGGSHACVAVGGAANANQDGLWCWGANDLWQLGDGGAASPGASAPIQASRVDQQARVDGLVVAGGAHTCAWRVGDASVKCGGRADDLQVGVPVTVGALTVDRLDVTPGGTPLALAAGSAHTCALTDQGLAGIELKCWGRNAEGQLGRPTAAGAPDGTAGVVPP